VIQEEIRSDLWERFFLHSLRFRKFSRENVIEVMSIKSSTIRNNIKCFCGIFKLTDGTFGMMDVEYGINNNTVLLAIQHTHPVLEYLTLELEEPLLKKPR